MANLKVQVVCTFTMEVVEGTDSKDMEGMDKRINEAIQMIFKGGFISGGILYDSSKNNLRITSWQTEGYKV